MRKRFGLLTLSVAAVILASCQGGTTAGTSSVDSTIDSSYTSDTDVATIVIEEGITGGTISIDGYESGDEVKIGTTVQVSASPDDGFILSSLSVNGESILDTMSFDVEEAVTYTITASFAEESQSLTTGSIDFVSIPRGGNFYLGLGQLQLDGIEVSNVTSTTLFNDDTYADGEVRLGTGNNEGSITFTFPEAISIKNVTLNVRQYKDYNCTIDVTAGDQKVSKIYSDPSFDFSGEAVDTLSISVSGGDNRCVLEDLSIQYFGGEQLPPTPATISVEKTGEGEVTLSPSSGFVTGDTLTVTAAPAEGYYLSTITLNGSSGHLVSSYVYTFTIQDAENTLTVIFRQSTGGNQDFSYLYGNTAVFPDRGSQSVDIDDYYLPVKGLKGEALKEGLHEIINDHKTFGYSSLGQSDWEYIDEDPFNSNNFYVTYQGSTSKGYSVNKEHTWAKSHGDFGTAAPAGSDLNNLRGSNANLNSARGNLDFGTVSPHSSSTSVVDKYNWAESSMAGNYVGGGYFEPKDEFKGDVARIIFYMATRYEGDRSGEPDLEVGGDIDTSLYYDFTAGATGLHGNFADLYEWATSGIDPVSDYEVSRNNRVDQDYQHNRNPFIDHPEFIVMIYDKTYDGPGALE